MTMTENEEARLLAVGDRVQIMGGHPIGDALDIDVWEITHVERSTGLVCLQEAGPGMTVRPAAVHVSKLQRVASAGLADEVASLRIEIGAFGSLRERGYGEQAAEIQGSMWDRLRRIESALRGQPAERSRCRFKSAHSCRVCGRWLEGEWSAADAAQRVEIQRQMDAGHCDACHKPGDDARCVVRDA